MELELLFFFFSSRRRHTRYIGDWSSDVCSSDLSDGQSEDASDRQHGDHDRDFHVQTAAARRASTLSIFACSAVSLSAVTEPSMSISSSTLTQLRHPLYSSVITTRTGLRSRQVRTAMTLIA